MTIKAPQSAKNVNFKKLKLLGDTIIAKPQHTYEIGGIIIPVSEQEAKTKSRVVAKARSVKDVKIGQLLFHSQYAGSELLIEGEKFIIMHRSKFDKDVFGVYHGKERAIDIKPFDDRVLLQWEEGLLEYGKTRILRSKTEVDRHYTGICIAKGPDCQEVEVGKRYFWDRFCGPERIDFEGKRYAFVYEHSVYMEIPTRAEMEDVSS